MHLKYGLDGSYRLLIKILPIVIYTGHPLCVPDMVLNKVLSDKKMIEITVALLLVGTHQFE